MEDREELVTTVLDWIKSNEPHNDNPHRRFQFPAQRVSQETRGKADDPDVVDALWKLVTAGILIPSTSHAVFELSGWGKEAIQQDTSPYQKDKFVLETKKLAPRLEPDSLAYLLLGLDCVHGMPGATIALIRVALEIEIDSVIESFIESQKPGNASLRKLTNRNISTRADELLYQLRNRSLFLTEDQDKLLESYINQIRISGNKILHPKDGLPFVDPMLVESVLHAFRSFASIASELKATF